MNDTTLRPHLNSRSAWHKDITAQVRMRRAGPSSPGRCRRTALDAHDMISFGEAYLGHNEVNGKPVSAELIAAMQLAQKPIYTIRTATSRPWPGQRYARRQSLPASRDSEERRNIRFGSGDRDFQPRRGHLHRHEPRSSPISKALRSSASPVVPLNFIARTLCFSIFAAAIPSPKVRRW